MQWRAPTLSDQQILTERSTFKSAVPATFGQTGPISASFTDQHASYLSARFGRSWAVRVPAQQGFGTNRYVDVVLGALAGGTVVGVITDVIDPTSLTGVLAVIHGLALPVLVILASRRAEAAPRRPMYLAQADTWTDEA